MLRNVHGLIEEKNKGGYKTQIMVHHTAGLYPKLGGGLLNTKTAEYINAYKEVFKDADDKSAVAFIPWHSNLTPDFRVTKNPPLEITERRPCAHLWMAITISWDGKVTMCCNDVNLEVPMGGDLKKQSIEEAWQSFERRWIRYRHLNHNLEGLPCATCWFPWFHVFQGEWWR